VKEALLETLEPVPGKCERGFVVFQMPRGERPEFVVFEEQFKAEGRRHASIGQSRTNNAGL
jgi:hypothetical protein